MLLLVMVSLLVLALFVLVFDFVWDCIGGDGVVCAVVVCAGVWSC